MSDMLPEDVRERVVAVIMKRIDDAKPETELTAAELTADLRTDGEQVTLRQVRLLLDEQMAEHLANGTWRRTERGEGQRSQQVYVCDQVSTEETTTEEAATPRRSRKKKVDDA